MRIPDKHPQVSAVAAANQDSVRSGSDFCGRLAKGARSPSIGGSLAGRSCAYSPVSYNANAAKCTFNSAEWRAPSLSLPGGAAAGADSGACLEATTMPQIIELEAV